MSRTDLHTVLEGILGSDNVYFQPPSSIQMSYPCIVYQRSDIRSHHANNLPYKHKKEYTITIIDKNPDSSIPMEIAQMESASFERHFKADNLNHDVFTIFF